MIFDFNDTYAQELVFELSPDLPIVFLIEPYGGPGTPSSPIITSPTNNSTIQNSSITIYGTAIRDTTVTLYNGATIMGTATATSTGYWSIQVTLSDGEYSFTATVYNGVSTSASSIPVNVTIDTLPESTFTEWTQNVLDLRLTKSQTFQDTFPIDTDDDINRLLAWAGNPVAQANNSSLQQFGHLYSAMKKWNERTDLQAGFPGANLAEDMTSIIIWSGRENVLANSFNSDLVPHESTYVLLRILFLERDDLRANPAFEGSLDGSDPSRLYCWAQNSQDTRLTPHQTFYTVNCSENLLTDDNPPTNLVLPYATSGLDLEHGASHPLGVFRFSLDIQSHPGIDLQLFDGTAILAMGDGTIVNIIEGDNPVDMGILLQIEQSLWGINYEHFIPDEALFIGKEITKGEQIGVFTGGFTQIPASIHIDLRYYPNGFTGFSGAFVCWVDSLVPDDKTELQSAWDDAKVTDEFIQGWSTLEMEGNLIFNGLLDSENYPDGPQMCYPIGTDVREPV